MRIIKVLGRLGVLLASLGAVAVTYASRASASTGMFPVPGGDEGTGGTGQVVIQPPVIHTVVVGGMPGWQIAVIAAAAALVAAVAAVLVDRARRRLLGTPA